MELQIVHPIQTVHKTIIAITAATANKTLKEFVAAAPV
jgi:hypothetical protein